jgi:oligoendopeptidase F
VQQIYEIVKRYFGKRVVCDREIAFEWMRTPHFYMNFYVYKYATCISAASSIVKKIEERGDEYIAKYLRFLSLGGSMSPLDSLAVAGIDLTKPDVIKDAIDDFEAAIKQFREIAGVDKK